MLFGALPPTLRRGSRGPDVERLQTLLSEAIQISIPIDGAFGAGTESLVRQFQAQRGLTPDGIVGPQTWAALGVMGASDELPAPGEPNWLWPLGILAAAGIAYMAWRRK